MPQDRLVDREAPPRRGTGRGGTPVTLVRALQRGVPSAIGPALVAASAMLLAGQLFSAYRTMWPTDSSGQFQQGSADLSMRLAYVIGSPFTVPLITTSLPVLVFAGLARLPAGSGLPVRLRLRLAARVTALLVTLTAVVVFVGAAVWTLITRGEVGSQSDGMGYFAVDPVSTFLSRGGDGLAAAVLAGVACWLLWAPVETTAAPDPAPAAAAEAAVRDLATTTATLPLEAAGPLPLADPAYQRGSVVQGSPAHLLTRGTGETLWQQGDPSVFRRPSARPVPGPESTSDDALESADPGGRYRRPAR